MHPHAWLPVFLGSVRCHLCHQPPFNVLGSERGLPGTLISLAFLRMLSLGLAASTQQHPPPFTAQRKPVTFFLITSLCYPNGGHMIHPASGPTELCLSPEYCCPAPARAAVCGADLRFPLLTSVLFGEWWLGLGMRAVSLSAIFFFCLVQIFLKCFPGLQTAWMSCQGRSSSEHP